MPHKARFVDINVRNLMIAHSKCTAGKSVELLTEWPVADLEKSFLVKDTIEIDRKIDVDVRVFIDDPNRSPGFLGGIQYRFACGV